MKPIFHLSLAVKSIPESIKFFTEILQATVTHQDPRGHVNINFHGAQITLKENPNVSSNLPDFTSE